VKSLPGRHGGAAHAGVGSASHAVRVMHAHLPIFLSGTLGLWASLCRYDDLLRESQATTNGPVVSLMGLTERSRIAGRWSAHEPLRFMESQQAAGLPWGSAPPSSMCQPIGEYDTCHYGW